MLSPGPALRVSIYVGEGHHRHGHSVAQSLYDLLYQRRVAGATLFRAVAGFGAGHHPHSADLLAASENLPLLIEFIESREAVEALLPEIRTLLGDGLILTQPVEVYAAGDVK
jgi:hypothetical protein